MSFPCLKKTPAVGNAGMLYPRDPRLRGMDRIIGRRCRIWPPRPPKPTSGSNSGTPPSHVLSKQALIPIRPSYSMATPNDDSGRRAKPPPTATPGADSLRGRVLIIGTIFYLWIAGRVLLLPIRSKALSGTFFGVCTRLIWMLADETASERLTKTFIWSAWYSTRKGGRKDRRRGRRRFWGAL
jgi:hypothetical protein